MARRILGFVAGMLVMWIIVAVAFVVILGVMGPDNVFRQGTWNASMKFIVATSILSLIGAVVGGAVCQIIARRRSVAIVLAALVLIMGFAMVAIQASQQGDEPPPPRPADTTIDQMKEARKNGWIREPRWVSIMNPPLGAAGVLFGALLAAGNAPAPRPRATAENGAEDQ